MNLVNLNHTVNLAYKVETSKESNRASQKEEKEHHDEGVSKVQECTCSVLNLKLCCEIVTAVDEKINGRESTR